MQGFNKNKRYSEMSTSRLAAYIIDAQRPMIREALEVCHDCFSRSANGPFPPAILEGLDAMRSRFYYLLNEEDQELMPVLSQVAEGKTGFDKKNLLDRQTACKLRHAELVQLLQTINHMATTFREDWPLPPSVKLCYARLRDFEQDVLRHVFLLDEMLFPKVYELVKEN